MSQKLAKLVEAERRGLLTGRSRELLLEARRRGLVAEPKNEVAQAITQASEVNAGLARAVAELVTRTGPATVNVPAPEVHVAAPRVTVQPAEVVLDDRPWTFHIIRDRNGWIESVRAERV